MDYCGFSIRGTIKNVDHLYLDEIFAKNPYLNEIYADDLEGAKKDLRVLEITPITVLSQSSCATSNSKQKNQSYHFDGSDFLFFQLKEDFTHDDHKDQQTS